MPLRNPMTRSPDVGAGAGAGAGAAADTGTGDAAVAHAEESLARLNRRVDEMRAVLVGLLQEVVLAESQISTNKANQLVEANAQLMVAALRNQAQADSAEQALDEVARSAGHDPLTELPTRSLLLDRFAHAISNARRRSTRVALLFVDLDEFKQINDTFGHAMGDRALECVAHSLTASVRESDTVSRHGGDEFVILLSEIALAQDAALIASKVIATLAGVSELEGHAICLKASIGISLFPDDGDEPQALIELADAAMYQAKRHAPGSFVFHGEELVDQRGAAHHLPSPAYATSHHVSVLAEHERRHAMMQAANEQLMLTAVNAQRLQLAAEQAARRHVELMASVARELGNPLAPIRVARALLDKAQTGEPALPQVQLIIDEQVHKMTRLADELLDATAARSDLVSGVAADVGAGAEVSAAVDASVTPPGQDAAPQRRPA